jgi:uncharacterized protein
MLRKIENHLISWSSSENRKPLVITGARQVGKSHTVKAIAKKLGLELLELNLEKNPELHACFQGNLDPLQIISRIASKQS